jgi:hypothetical protein
MMALIWGDGYLKKKNVFKAEHRMTKNRPRSAARKVKTTDELGLSVGALTWHVPIIEIGDGRSDLWVWTVLVEGIPVLMDDTTFLVAPVLGTRRNLTLPVTVGGPSIRYRHISSELGQAIASSTHAPHTRPLALRVAESAINESRLGTDSSRRCRM